MRRANIARGLGILAALCLPALVVAQQFAPGQPLRAADLQALAASVTQLSARVAALENAVASGPSTRLFASTAVNGTTTYKAASDGFVVAVPGGVGFDAVSLQASINSAENFRHFRSTSGDTLTAIVSQGDDLTLTVDGLAAPVSVSLFWYALHRSSAAPSCALAGCGL